MLWVPGSASSIPTGVQGMQYLDFASYGHWVFEGGKSFEFYRSFHSFLRQVLPRLAKKMIDAEDSLLYFLS